ncbi:MAG: hypothetical protein WAW79_10965 [Steroidobacteraceae bacterium]
MGINTFGYDMGMVTFMAKWAIAAIPAIIILVVLGVAIAGIFGGMFGGLFR